MYKVGKFLRKFVEKLMYFCAISFIYYYRDTALQRIEDTAGGGLMSMEVITKLNTLKNFPYDPV
jgi:hypothetical protein